MVSTRSWKPSWWPSWISGCLRYSQGDSFFICKMLIWCIVCLLVHIYWYTEHIVFCLHMFCLHVNQSITILIIWYNRNDLWNVGHIAVKFHMNPTSHLWVLPPIAFVSSWIWTGNYQKNNHKIADFYFFQNLKNQKSSLECWPFCCKVSHESNLPSLSTTSKHVCTILNLGRKCSEKRP